MQRTSRLLTTAFLLAGASSAGAQLDRPSEVELRSYGTIKVLLVRDSIKAFAGGLVYLTQYTSSGKPWKGGGLWEVMSCKTGAMAAVQGDGARTKEAVAFPRPLEWVEQAKRAEVEAELRRHCGGGAPQLQRPHHVGLATGTDGMAYFVDLATIRISGDIRTVWGSRRKVKYAPRPHIDKLSGDELKVLGREVVSGFAEHTNTFKALHEYDCGARTVRLKSQVEYDPAGVAVRQLDEQAARGVVPETAAEVTLNFLCGL